jgi:hypothetical protein
VALIGESGRQGYIGERNAGLQQVDRSLLNSQILDVFGDGLALELAKSPGNLIGVNAGFGRQALDANAVSTLSV